MVSIKKNSRVQVSEEVFLKLEDLAKYLCEDPSDLAEKAFQIYFDKLDQQQISATM